MLAISLILAALPLADVTAPAPIEVTTMAAGGNVVHRSLEEPGVLFPADGEPVWVHVTVKNPGGPTAVTLVWLLEGDERWRIDLNVGQSPRWRTWARKRMRRGDTGQWTVEARDAEGRVLRSVQFDVEAAPPVESRAARLPFEDLGC